MDEEERAGLSPMMQQCIILNENYQCLLASGFTEEQAIYLLGQHVLGVAGRA